jgi:hypothetical protein
MAKPVSLTIQFKLPPDGKVSKASILPNGDIVLLDEKGEEIVPVYMDRTLQYSRKKGPKIQNRRKFEGQYTSVNGTRELASFASIFAIDTNTRSIRGAAVSASCFVCCRLQHKAENYVLECEPRVNFYEFHNVRGNAEFLGILKVANDVERSAGLTKNDRFAIVTDAHLGSHDLLNGRRAALYGAHVLPARFQLIYASSDTGQEIVNGLIRLCDQQSTQYLELYEKEELPHRKLKPLTEDPSVLYAYVFRNDLKVGNPILTGLKLQEGTKVSLYGRRLKQFTS